MSTRNYPRLIIEDFGIRLLESGDLDPVYIALSRMDWDKKQRDRFLVAYWCCYHVGASCWMSELQDTAFWRGLLNCAHNGDRHPALVGNGRWPRAPERRHWRAHNAVSCVEHLVKRYPEGAFQMVDALTAPTLTRDQNAAHGGDALETLPFKLISTRVQTHVSFGPWIAYKVADMLERCCDVPVSFAQDDAMYDSPRQAALRVWKIKAGVAEDVKIRDEGRALRDVVNHLLLFFKDYDAPPSGGRKVSYQEVETILCKWNSHMNGHYPLNNDLVEISAGLRPWSAVSRTALKFLHRLPVV